MSGALIVFAKEPAPGRVKTRLCPPLSPEQAAELYACMLDDVLRASAEMAEQLGLLALLAVDPPDSVARMAARAPASVAVTPQRGPDLGARMEHALFEAAAAGRGPLLLRGSDSPALPIDTVRAALHALEAVDLVLAPDLDGGYGLVGLRRPAAGLFSHPMSTGTVLADTLAAAESLGLTHRLVAPGFDVDEVADLRRLREVPENLAQGLFPVTLAWLERAGR